MDFQQIRKYVKGVLTNSFTNKSTLDKLSTSNEGNLLFDGKEIKGSGGSGGINVEKDILLENITITKGQILEYLKPIENYDYIAITIRDSVGNRRCEYIPKENYELPFAIQNWTNNNGYIGIIPSTGEILDSNNCIIDNIIGYRFNELGNIHNYSTEEKVVGKWIDGKPIYEKTFSSITITNNTDNFVSDDFGNKTIRHLQIDFNGISNTLSSSNGYTDTLFVNDNNQLIYYFSRSGSWWDGLNTANITVQYTKTTD